MHKCFAYAPYYIQHSENSEYEPGQKLKKLASQLVLLKSASSVYSRQLGSQLYTKYTLCYLMLSKWANWASTQWKLLLFCLKTDFLSFFIYVLCYIFWFSRSVSNMLSTTFNWAKWAKWVGLIQGQELNISLWNLFLWIQCPRIGERDRNSYFYHQMLFLEVILLSTLSKMSNFMAKTSKFCLGTHSIGFSTFQLG